jgi:hypothetical protein
LEFVPIGTDQGIEQWGVFVKRQNVAFCNLRGSSVHFLPKFFASVGVLLSLIVSQPNAFAADRCVEEKLYDQSFHSVLDSKHFFFWLKKSFHFGGLESEPLNKVNIQRSIVTTDFWMFDDELPLSEDFRVSMNSQKGVALDPEAIQVKKIRSHTYHFLGFDITVHQYQADLLLHMFRFGAGASAAEIFQKASEDNKKIKFQVDLRKSIPKKPNALLRVVGLYKEVCEPPPNPPLVTIDRSSVSAMTRERQATFDFSSNEMVQFFCSLDGSSAQPCTSPEVFQNLMDGNHEFSVYGSTSDGRTSAAARFRWLVDGTGPVLAFTSIIPQEIYTSQTSILFQFVSSEAGITECQIDGGPWANCSSPLAINQLADGAHLFSVRAADALGNPSQIISHSWNVKTQNPDVTITGVLPAENPSRSTTYEFRFTGANGSVQFLCSLDNSSPAPCVSPVTYNNLSEGAHLFQVVSVDLAGNLSVAATHSFMVDLTVPVLSLASVSPSGALTNLNTINFTLLTSESSTLSCALDGLAVVPCNLSQGFSMLAEGPHQFLVTATDPAGNVSLPLVYNWTVDLTIPVVSLVSAQPQPRLFTGRNLQLQFSSSESSQFQCGLDSQPSVDCSAGMIAYSALLDGIHQVSIVATDLAGNTSVPYTYGFEVDNTAPMVAFTVVSPSLPLTSQTDIHFEFRADQAATFECSLDGAAFSACLSPVDFAALSNGPHSFEVRGIDATGNVSAAPATHRWTIDNIAPTTTITSVVPIANPTASLTATFQFSSSEAATFECQLDGLGFAACASPHSYNQLADGNHTFEVRSRDSAGNLEAQGARYVWTIDSRPLTISQLSVTGITRTSADLSWITNFPSDSQIAYTSDSVYLFTPVDPTLTTAHAQSLTNLAPNTFYTVYVISVTAEGQQAVSSIVGFRTLR